MRKFLISLALTSAIAALPAMASAKGCLKGAAVGGAAGHVAGHHGSVRLHHDELVRSRELGDLRVDAPTFK